MSSRQEWDKLDDKNKFLGQKLSEVEGELSRKEENLRAANQKKAELLTDLRQHQHKVKDLKSQLERSESAALEARGIAHEHKLAEEAFESALRDKTASFKSAINSLQLEIKTLKSRLSDKEDQYDTLTAKLQSNEERMQSFLNEKSRSDKENNAKFSNLTLVLKQAKQTSAELTEQNEEYKRKEWEWAQRLEEMKLETGGKSKPGDPSKPPAFLLGEDKEFAYGRLLRSSSIGCITPGRHIPEETKIGNLQEENVKLKKELSCLQTNFQLTAIKTTQLRGEIKEMETTMADLQAQLEKEEGEKIEVHQKYEEAKIKLDNLNGSKEVKGEADHELRQQIELLQKELDHLQADNISLQGRMKSGLGDSREGKNLVKKLKTRAKLLEEEKAILKKETAALHERTGILQKKLEESSSSKEELQSKTFAAVTALEHKTSHLSKEKDDACKELKLLCVQFEEAQGEIQTLKDKIKTLGKKEKAIISQSVTTIPSDLPNKLESLQDKIQELREETKQLKSQKEELESEKKVMEGRISELNKVNKKLSHELSRETRRCGDLARKVTTELEMNEDKLLALESDVQIRTKECSVLKKKLKSKELEQAELKATLEEEILMLTHTMKEMDTSEHLLTLQLKETQQDVEKEKRACADVDQKKLELESKLEAVQHTILEKDSVISDLKCANELVVMENTTLLAQVTSLSEMVSTRNLKLESQHTQINRQESEVFEILETISELEVEHQNCKSTISELTRKNEAMTTMSEAQFADRIALEAKISVLRDDLEELKSTDVALQITNTDLIKKLEELSSKNEDLVSRVTESEDKARDLERDLKAESSCLKICRMELQHVQKMSETNKTEMGEKTESLLAKLEESEQCRIVLQEKKSELKTKITELEREIEETKFMCSFVQNEKDHLNEQYERLRESALSVILSESIEVTTPRGDVENIENVLAAAADVGDIAGKKEKDLEKKPALRKALQPINN